ncbi:hypothetical protein VOLCADRAFT_97305 [Volvox carteri f. nagariensis]|uniref:Uncharacterized protein n=1 Tax=Volvox carteri f. nagariensis TaxID=3068 RepID=D8UCE9_VOLCA|nr:uncharacterized protein VOLCADRAFT_97305 [Volvox carteri f. nagariensis]EFJ42685.1 hypothetical protein VOLCADRAFT_97305 [Volvox carteri f. nagariensis]|eukprot:XP_002956336.1 hypothetical protein VOLCADRAFT_97305 [Volvox carteri f. nagariensis]
MENVREAKRAKPGPKPSAVLDYFEEVGDYSSSSKRYARKCKFRCPGLQASAPAASPRRPWLLALAPAEPPRCPGLQASAPAACPRRPWLLALAPVPGAAVFDTSGISQADSGTSCYPLTSEVTGFGDGAVHGGFTQAAAYIPVNGPSPPPVTEEDADPDWNPLDLEEYLNTIYMEEEQQRAPLMGEASMMGMPVIEAENRASMSTVEALLRTTFPWFDWTKQPLELNPGQKAMSFTVGE